MSGFTVWIHRGHPAAGQDLPDLLVTFDDKETAYLFAEWFLLAYPDKVMATQKWDGNFDPVTNSFFVGGSKKNFLQVSINPDKNFHHYGWKGVKDWSRLTVRCSEEEASELGCQGFPVWLSKEMIASSTPQSVIVSPKLAPV